jgi:hypothetical protein
VVLFWFFFLQKCPTQNDMWWQPWKFLTSGKQKKIQNMSV